MRGRAVPFRAVVPPMSPVFTPDFSSVVPTISAMRGQHVCRRRMLSSGQRHLLSAELARPVMPSSSPARAPGIATAWLLQCVLNSHCLWLLSCVVDACVVSCAWNCTLACVSCMVVLYSHVNVSVNVAGSVARVSFKILSFPCLQHSFTQRQAAGSGLAADASRQTASIAHIRCTKRTAGYIQRARIQHAHGDLHERRAVRGVCTYHAHSTGARAATALAAARTHSVATRRHATSIRPRRIGATRPRRAPRRRCRPARRPLSHPPRVPCGCTACQYLRRNERRTGHPQTPARDVQPTARRRGRSASTKRPFRRWAGTSATRAGSCASAVIHMMPADMLHARTPTSPPEAAA